MTPMTTSIVRRTPTAGLSGLLMAVGFAFSAAPALAVNTRGLPPPSQARTTNASANVTYAPKPKPKHHKPKSKPKPRHRPRRHHVAHTYVYQLGFPEETTEVSNCSVAPYTMTTNVGFVNAGAQSLVGNSFPLTTIRFQPGQTLFKITDAPSESGNAQFVQSICDFAAPNGDSANCAVQGTATYRTSTPARSLSELTRRPAYSVTGVVDNVTGNYPCGNTPEMPPF